LTGPLKLAREEQMLDQTRLTVLLLARKLHMRSKSSGGIRGAAQLLEHELEKPGLREYTQVIIQEADRLRTLMEKLLTPQHVPISVHSIFHEVWKGAQRGAGRVIERLRISATTTPVCLN